MTRIENILGRRIDGNNAALVFKNSGAGVSSYTVWKVEAPGFAVPMGTTPFLSQARQQAGIDTSAKK